MQGRLSDRDNGKVGYQIRRLAGEASRLGNWQGRLTDSEIGKVGYQIGRLAR